MTAGAKSLTAPMAALLLTACATAAAPSASASAGRPSPTAVLPPPTALESGCPANPDVALPALSAESTPADAVSAYLAAGGDPATLGAELFDRGWMSPQSTLVWTDVDGDGSLDFAAGLTGAPDAQGIAYSGSVVLWLCEGGTYRRMQAASARPDFGLPALLEVRDLTADGVPEMVVAYPRCGAHTCFEQLAVLQWDGDALVDRFRGASDDLPYPRLRYKGDGTGRPLSIEVTGTAIGSVGAGPFRVRSRTWTWGPATAAFLPGPLTFEAPRYRIHVIHDADDAFEAGRVQDALRLYQRAIEDDSLLDWPSAGDGREGLSAYAAFRRVFALLEDGQPDQAQAELEARFTGTSATTSAYAEFARGLLEGYSEGRLAQACDEVASLAAGQIEVVLAPLNLGYDNRVYAAEDLCRLSGAG